MTEYTSQALSRRLHDKGFRAEHEMVWIKLEKWEGGLAWVSVPITLSDAAKMTCYDRCPAYTFTELWAVVPDEIKGDYEIAMTKDSTGTYVCYEEFSHGECISSTESFFHESPAEALGLLVEWLVDNGHLTLREVE